MSYVDISFYTETFGGNRISDDEFRRLEEIASMLVYDACILKPTEDQEKDEMYKKAICYQIELLESVGGIDSITGMADISISAGSESLGDYSVSGGTSSGQYGLSSINGVPVSPMSILLLRRLGLMRAWAYAEYYERRSKGNGK